MRRLRILVILPFVLVAAPFFVHAQATTAPDTVNIEKAKVIQVTGEQTETIPDTGATEQVQTLTAQILSGPDEGQVITFQNDYTQLSVGDLFYARHDTNALDGTDTWSVSDPYRLNILLGLAVAFLVLLLVFGGIQGLRALASLCGSVILIFFVLLPGILHGYSAIGVSVGVAALIIIVGSYLTHGFNKTTTAAVVGMIATVIVTGLGAFWVVHAAHLTGYSTEEAVYLNFDTNGTINMVGVLFGGIMIGLLGVLYDIAIGQAVAVEELFRAGVHMNRFQIYRRAIRIGREHIGALVNTLLIAYVGVSLPLLLLADVASTMSLASEINSELFATEAVRILVGGIGVVLAVPITTLIASYMLAGTRGQALPSSEPTHHH